jgi:hypothetical protein
LKRELRNHPQLDKAYVIRELEMQNEIQEKRKRPFSGVWTGALRLRYCGNTESESDPMLTNLREKIEVH